MSRRLHSFRVTTLAAQRGNALLIVLLVLAVAGGGYVLWQRIADDETTDGMSWSLTPPLEPSDLSLTVTGKGSLEAVDPHIVLNEVEGKNAILSIVDEGTMLTADDVANKRVLIQLDTSDIDERLQRLAIDVKSAESSLENARSALAIQLHQNASDIRKAELALHFARLDLARYIGDTLTSRLEARERPTAGDGSSNVPASSESSAESSAVEGSTHADLARTISTMLEDPELDGEAMQKRRELESEIRLADEESRRAQDKYNHSKRLEGKGFISREELDADQLAQQRREIEAERARTARTQFARYDFPKETQRLWTDFLEAEDKLDRARDKAAAEERKARSELRTRDERHKLQVRRFNYLLDQRKRCTIVARKTGMVVYASSGNEHRWRDADRIQEGTVVRERQALLRVLDRETIAGVFNVHESMIRHVEVGQQAHVRVDAKPGERLLARVTEVARLPSATNRWLNPDLKVYKTSVVIQGAHTDLKPGMSCAVEILTGSVDNTLSVPVQAVVGPTEAPAVYVADAAGEIERVPVVLGPANELRVAITKA